MAASDIIFNINDKVEIIEKGRTYKSLIQDIGSSSICIGVPIYNYRSYPLHIGETLEYYVNANKEVYKCLSVILGRKAENNVQLIELSMPENPIKVQRREFFRLPIVMDIKYYALPSGRVYSGLKDIPSGYFERMKKSITLDISGGGMKAKIDEEVKKGNFLIISFGIPEEIMVIASVVWCQRDEKDKNYKAALKFESIKENERDKIIRFIFSKSRDQSKLIR